MAAVTSEGHKLVFGFDGSLRLYDRTVDRGESTDRYVPGDPTAEALWALLLPRVELLAAAAPEVPLVLP